ncbi:MULTISPECIES: hypothetical protein [unclassified Spirosoma]|uniref:hypothetical protein n=1 Tax=unclassified Spirosoma TaxID=2621999 RepID=UPI00095A643D|nr:MULTISPECIES: hypothetical protein [unclassified Spirosoma]MBN8821246.1 hypothetical protein [Spirosoma sp.]OJW79128.1 MAG: hypothetical protein BGO59_11295 [Spirosoma sp. 48-14]
MGDAASIGQLVTDEMFFEKAAQQFKIPVSCVDLVFRSTVSLVMACLHKQLQTDIGKGLIYRTLEKQTLQGEGELRMDVERPISVELSITEGNRLFGILLPGKKSPIMTSVIHHSRLSYKQVDQLVGLCAYCLFDRMASQLKQHHELASVLIPFKELSKVAPELDEKDYRSIGLHDNLSFFKTAPTYISI